ncbi:MAG: hypothetical protein F4Z08_07260 [Chloroflexi bacterium]|nr:hypothetical protein [Chloroflexota bacterium]
MVGEMSCLLVGLCRCWKPSLRAVNPDLLREEAPMPAAPRGLALIPGLFVVAVFAYNAAPAVVEDVGAFLSSATAVSDPLLDEAGVNVEGWGRKISIAEAHDIANQHYPPYQRVPVDVEVVWEHEIVARCGGGHGCARWNAEEGKGRIIVQSDSLYIGVVLHELAHVLTREGHTDNWWRAYERLFRRHGIWKD